MMKRPYRLANRARLSPAPPFTPELVRAKIVEAMCGPKKGRTTYAEPSADAIKYLTATLNVRHQFFYSAQEDRSRKDRRDRAAELIDELREIMPAITKDAEMRRLKADDFFSRNTERAAHRMHDFITSDVPERALPLVTLPENVAGWQWCSLSLYCDVKALIGANAAVRFIVAVVPLLSGETPKMASMQTWLKQQKGRVGGPHKTRWRVRFWRKRTSQCDPSRGVL